MDRKRGQEDWISVTRQYLHELYAEIARLKIAVVRQRLRRGRALLARRRTRTGAEAPAAPPEEEA